MNYITEIKHKSILIYEHPDNSLVVYKRMLDDDDIEYIEKISMEEAELDTNEILQLVSEFGLR